MHHGEERVTGQFKRSKERERKQRKNEHIGKCESWIQMMADGDWQLNLSKFRQKKVKGEIKMR